MPAPSPEDGAISLLIVSAIAIVSSCLILCVRVVLRRNINAPLGWDDAACAIATSIAVAGSVTTIVAVHSGLGYHRYDITAGYFDRVIILLWLIQILYVLAVGFSLLSAACLVHRISQYRPHLIWARVTIVLIGMWILASTLTVAFQCAMPIPWDFDSPPRCVNEVCNADPVGFIARLRLIWYHEWHLWLCVTIMQAVLESCSLKAAFVLVGQAPIPRKSKTKLFVAFALRLFILPPTFARLMIIKRVSPSHDRTRDWVRVILLDQIVMHIGISVTAVPGGSSLCVLLERRVSLCPSDPGYPATQSSRSSGHAIPPPRTSTRPLRTFIPWDYRSTFAKGDGLPIPAPVVPRHRVKIAPWTWNRWDTFADPALRGMSLLNHRSISSTSSSRSDSRRSRPARSSDPSSLRLYRPRASMHEGSGRWYEMTPGSSQSSSRWRHQSGWSGTLSLDVGKTVSTVSHDPVAAAQWHDLRPDETASERDVRTAGIGVIQTFEVTYSSREERSASKD